MRPSTYHSLDDDILEDLANAGVEESGSMPCGALAAGSARPMVQASSAHDKPAFAHVGRLPRTPCMALALPARFPGIRAGREGVLMTYSNHPHSWQSIDNDSLFSGYFH